MSKSFTSLNSDQQLAAYKINSFIRNPASDGKVFCLTGGPGTGKTYMLRTILDSYKGNVQAATVSHAAKNILQESLGSRVTCVTLAKLLGLTMTISDEGVVKFIRPENKRRYSQIEVGGILIIDEVSQIEDDIVDMILEEADTHNVKIIAVGDPYQLPPVEQSHDSKFFQQIDSTLTIPMRFQGPIADLASIYRNEIDVINQGGGFDRWALNTHTARVGSMVGDTGYAFTNKLEEIIERAADDIVSHPKSTSYARVLAFKNESVAEINRLIRRKIYGENLRQFEKSELVICNGGYSIMQTSFDGRLQRIPLLYNGQVLKVKSYTPILGPYDVPCVAVTFENFSTNGLPVYVVEHSYEGKYAYDTILSAKLHDAKTAPNVYLAREAWKRYYSFIELFANFDYAYSVNLYKAQGQTLNNVYVCEGEVMNVGPLTWKQKFQALYVAMTRAKEKLFIYNKEF